MTILGFDAGSRTLPALPEPVDPSPVVASWALGDAGAGPLAAGADRKSVV